MNLTRHWQPFYDRFVNDLHQRQICSSGNFDLVRAGPVAEHVSEVLRYAVLLSPAAYSTQRSGSWRLRRRSLTCSGTINLYTAASTSTKRHDFDWGSKFEFKSVYPRTEYHSRTLSRCFQLNLHRDFSLRMSSSGNLPIVMKRSSEGAVLNHWILPSNPSGRHQLGYRQSQDKSKGTPINTVAYILGDSPAPTVHSSGLLHKQRMTVNVIIPQTVFITSVPLLN